MYSTALGILASVYWANAVVVCALLYCCFLLLFVCTPGCRTRVVGTEVEEKTSGIRFFINKHVCAAFGMSTHFFPVCVLVLCAIVI